MEIEYEAQNIPAAFFIPARFAAFWNFKCNTKFLDEL